VFFQEAVLLGGKFRDDLKAYPNNLKMVLATAQDPRAIGFAGLSFAMPDVRAVPLAFDSRSPFVAINSTAADAGRYPLVRPLQLVVNHATKKELRPVEQEFIKYVFSRRGQEDVIKAGLEVTPVQAVHIALDSVGLGVAR
jgi:phosphate transport system substrate-binding protein